MSNTTPKDAAFDPPLTEELFFSPGITASVFLFMLAQSATRSATRTKALEALIVALRPVVQQAVESTMPERLRNVSGDATLVSVAEQDLRRLLPTMRIGSPDDLILRVAQRAIDVTTAAVPMAPRGTSAPAPDGQHLLKVLPPRVAFALVSALHPALDDLALESITRMTRVDATWERVARELRVEVDVLRRTYAAARALAEDRIVYEIARRQPWPVAATIRLASQTHVA